MIFNADEKMYFLNRLPALELSYEPKLHKKVYAPVYYVIPKGAKALIWYTFWKDQNICLLIKLNEKGNYSDVQLFPTSFEDSLALGTIIYGTYFFNTQRTTQQQQQLHYFTCEQLYYYKGTAVAKKTYNERLNLLLDMFTTHVEQVAHTANSLVVGLPFMSDTYEEALAQMNNLPYKTYGIGAPRIISSSGTQIRPAKTTSAVDNNAIVAAPAAALLPHATYNKAIFKIKAGLTADNYQLYTAEDIFYETAMIPSYKCSVMMNTLFRNIKENSNLDLLEESDDDDEFENTKIDKFVDLEKTVMMECVYSKRFKKWQPVKSALKSPKLFSMKML